MPQASPRAGGAAFFWGGWMPRLLPFTGLTGNATGGRTVFPDGVFVVAEAGAAVP